MAALSPALLPRLHERGRHRMVPITVPGSCAINSRMAEGDRGPGICILISMHKYGSVTRKSFETVHAWIGFDDHPPRTLQGLPELQCWL